VVEQLFRKQQVTGSNPVVGFCLQSVTSSILVAFGFSRSTSSLCYASGTFGDFLALDYSTLFPQKYLVVIEYHQL